MRARYHRSSWGTPHPRDLLRARAVAAAANPEPTPNPYPAGHRDREAWATYYRAERRRLGYAPPAKPRTRPAPAARQAGACVQSLAQLAGTLCNNPAFITWAGCRDADEAAAWLRRVCGIASRRELDTNPAAARIFHNSIRRPFAASRES